MKQTGIIITLISFFILLYAALSEPFLAYLIFPLFVFFAILGIILIIRDFKMTDTKTDTQHKDNHTINHQILNGVALGVVIFFILFILFIWLAAKFRW